MTNTFCYGEKKGDKYISYSVANTKTNIEVWDLDKKFARENLSLNVLSTTSYTNGFLCLLRKPDTIHRKKGFLTFV